MRNITTRRAQDNMDIVASNIQRYRHLLKCTRKQLAQWAGVSATTIGRAERGEVNISLDTANKITKVFVSRLGDDTLDIRRGCDGTVGYLLRLQKGNVHHPCRNIFVHGFSEDGSFELDCGTVYQRIVFDITFRRHGEGLSTPYFISDVQDWRYRYKFDRRNFDRGVHPNIPRDLLFTNHYIPAVKSGTVFRSCIPLWLHPTTLSIGYREKVEWSDYPLLYEKDNLTNRLKDLRKQRKELYSEETKIRCRLGEIELLEGRANES